MHEALPGRGPVDGGGLVEVLGDRLETGSSEIAKNGVPRQMLTAMTEPIASVGSPRNGMLRWISPAFLSTQEMIP